MYVRAVEEVSPNWWEWPELGLIPASASSSPVVVDDDDGEDVADEKVAPSELLLERPAESSEAAAARPKAVAVSATSVTVMPAGSGGAGGDGGGVAASASAPLQLSPNALAVGGWSALPDDAAPARYRHACAVVGARLFVFGGRSNSGRLAEGLHQLNLLSGQWSTPATTGLAPDLRWGHSMNAFRQWCIVFGGHRRRGCLNDTAFLDTESHRWESPKIEGAMPPPRGNHSAVVVADRLWLFGGDAANAGVLPHTVWALALCAPSDASREISWSAVSATGEPGPPSCDHAAVAVGAQVLLLGGSNASGYLPFSRIPVFHTDTLSWSRLACGGAVPGARAGHVAAAVGAGGGGGWQLYIFGGGNSTSGFSDMHVLRDDATWRRLTSSTAPAADGAAHGAANGAGAVQPEATEGAAVAQSGGMILVFGGYTAAGATKRCFAWGCSDEDAAATKAKGAGTAFGPASAALVAASASRQSKGAKPSDASREGVVVLACPHEAHTQRHAQAAQGAFAERLGSGAEVMGVVASSGAGGPSAAEPDGVAQAESNEEALSLMMQRLHNLQLQRNAFGGQSTSLLGRARVLAAVQPCVYRLMAGGAPRTFVCFWVGAVDVATGRQAIGSSLSREVRAEKAGGWGKAAHAPSELDEDSSSALKQAWRSLLRDL